MPNVFELAFSSKLKKEKNKNLVRIEYIPRKQVREDYWIKAYLKCKVFQFLGHNLPKVFLVQKNIKLCT